MPDLDIPVLGRILESTKPLRIVSLNSTMKASSCSSAVISGLVKNVFKLLEKVLALSFRESSKFFSLCSTVLPFLRAWKSLPIVDFGSAASRISCELFVSSTEYSSFASDAILLEPLNSILLYT